MKKKIILFDVDGTIFNSFPGIAHCIDFALNYMDVKIERKLYKYFVGPPLIDSFKRYAYMDKDSAERAVLLFRKEYARVGKDMYEVYDGIIDAITNLRGKGFKIGTATSKPEEMAKLMFEEAGISKIFDQIVGSKNKFKEDKIDVIRDAVVQFNNANIDDYVLIGDTHFDLEAAKEIGMDCIIVKYGFGDEELFNKSEYCIDNPNDLIYLLEENN